MATAGPRRRSSDVRRPRPQPFGPTPGDIGPPDPDGVARSVEFALDAARRTRRPMTLVALSAPPSNEGAFARMAALVRRTLRETDGVWRDGPDSLILLLTDADGPASEPALARLRMRLKGEGFRDASMGRAAPAPGIRADDLLMLAREDLREISHG